MIKLGDEHRPEEFNIEGQEEFRDSMFDKEDVSADYDDIANFMAYRLHQDMADWLRPKMFDLPKNCAEIGIGNGNLSIAMFDNQVAPWDGYDISIKACEASKDLYRSTTKHDINVAPLPKKYDVIFICGMFREEILDATCIPNIVESLNEGGFLIATFPRLTNYWVKSGWYYDTKFELVDVRSNFKSGLRTADMGRSEAYYDIKQLQLVNVT